VDSKDRCRSDGSFLLVRVTLGVELTLAVSSSMAGGREKRMEEAVVVAAGRSVKGWDGG
jgi:hypothetical protein